MLGIRVTSRRRGTTATSCRTTKARAVPARSARGMFRPASAHRPPRRWSKLYIWTKRRWQRKSTILCISQNVTRRRTRRRAWRWAQSASSPTMLARTNPPCGWRSGTMRASTRPRILPPQRRRGGRPSLMREPPWVLNLVPRHRAPPQPQLPFPPQLHRPPQLQPPISPTLATVRYAPRGPTA